MVSSLVIISCTSDIDRKVAQEVKEVESRTVVSKFGRIDCGPIANYQGQSFTASAPGLDSYDTNNGNGKISLYSIRIISTPPLPGGIDSSSDFLIELLNQNSQLKLVSATVQNFGSSQGSLTASVQPDGKIYVAAYGYCLQSPINQLTLTLRISYSGISQLSPQIRISTWDSNPDPLINPGALFDGSRANSISRTLQPVLIGIGQRYTVTLIPQANYSSDYNDTKKYFVRFSPPLQPNTEIDISFEYKLSIQAWCTEGSVEMQAGISMNTNQSVGIYSELHGYPRDMNGLYGEVMNRVYTGTFVRRFTSQSERVIELYVNSYKTTYDTFGHAYSTTEVTLKNGFPVSGDVMEFSILAPRKFTANSFFTE